MIVKILHKILKLFLRKRKIRLNNILIISLHKLGDTVFTIPAINLINKKYPGRKVKIICHPESEIIYKKVLTNEIITLDKRNFIFGGRMADFKSVKTFRKISPEKIYDLTGNIISASLLLFNFSAHVIGFNKETYKSLYNNFKYRSKKLHLVKAFLDMLQNDLPQEEIDDLINVDMQPKRGSTLLIHPFGGWSAKEWNLHKFIELAEKLSMNDSYKIKFLFEKKSEFKKLKEELELKNFQYAETGNIEELIEEIEKCFMFVGNDSGPVYIAALLGKPTFSIYGPTNPDFSLPFGRHHSYIKKQITCSPVNGEQYCHTFAGRIGCPSFECMNQLTVEEVYESFQDFTKVILDKYSYY